MKPICLSIFLLMGQMATSQTLVPFLKKNGKYIFVEQGSLKPLNQIEYVGADLFHEGLAAIMVTDKWGFIDSNGNTVIQPKYDAIEPFNGGFAKISINNKTGLIDKSGREVHVPKYNQLERYEKGWISSTAEFKYGLIDLNGKELVAPKYDTYLYSIGVKLVRVGLKDKWGYIDEFGKVKVPLKFESIGNFASGLCPVAIKGKFGFVNKKGELIIPLKYEEALDFSEGLAAVKMNGKWGYMDETGKEIIPFRYGGVPYNPFAFQDGMAKVSLDDQSIHIDKLGHAIVTPKFEEDGFFNEGFLNIKLNGKWGYINKAGEIVISLQYDQAGSFKDDLAEVAVNGAVGFIDKTGKEVIPIKYTRIYPFKNGFANVELNSRYGAISIAGIEIIPPIYDNINCCVNGFAEAALEGKGFYVDTLGFEYREKVEFEEQVSNLFSKFLGSAKGSSSNKPVPKVITLDSLSIAKIPMYPNKTDAQGRRQGKWTILLDNGWSPITDTSETVNYRLIDYRDDLPTGLFLDYVGNGRISFTGSMLQDRPSIILTGPATWYNQDGVKETANVFNNGDMNRDSSVFFYTDESIISASIQILIEEGVALYKAGKLNEALPFLEKTLIRAKYELNTKSNDYLNLVDITGVISLETGNYSKAERFFLEAKDAREGLVEKEDPLYLNSLHNLGRVYEDMGNHSKAEPLYVEYLEISTRVYGKEHANYVLAISSLANVYNGLGDYPRALIFFLEAKEIAAKVLGKEHQEYIKLLNSLALNYGLMGRYSKAEPLFLEAKETRAKVLGKEHPQYVTTLMNLGMLYKMTGDYSKAEPLFLEVIETRAKVLGKQHPHYSVAINNLAGLYQEMGNYTKALPLFVEAMEINEKVFGKEHQEYALSLNNLALFCMAVEYDSIAEPLLLKAKEIFAKAFGKKHPDYATSVGNLALFYFNKGDYAKAEPFNLEAIEITKMVLGTGHRAYANRLHNLGGLYHAMGKYSKAEPLYLQAKDIWEKGLGKDHPDYSLSLKRLARLYEDLGNPAKAEPLYVQVISKIQQQIIRYFPSLSEKEKQDFYESNMHYMSDFERFCLERYKQNPTILSDLYNLKLATKGLLFNASNKIRQRILSGNNQELIDQFNLWQSKKDFLSKVYGMSPDEKRKNNIDDLKLEEEANAIEKELSLKSELFGRASGKTRYKWEDVRRKLNSGEAAIEMIRTIKKVDGQNAYVYAALMVSSQTQSQPDIVILENGTDLENKFSKFYNNSVKQKIIDEVSYNQYWKPLAEKLKGAKKVYFSADGVYNQINLNTLYNPATRKYVIDEIEVQLVTSTKDIITNTKTAQADVKNITLFGYPNYNNFKSSKPVEESALISSVKSKAAEIKKDSSQRFFNGESIAELPGTKVEVETIEALIEVKNITRNEYMFDEATEDEIKKLKSPQVLHIATHGFFLSDLAIPKENERGFAGMDSQKIRDNPLLRSGLLFAGAKNAFASSGGAIEGEDGILTAYEAMSLDLDQTDLVVMSACETGIGVTRNGEGVYGLQRAFQVAGAKSVLMSLWTVSDEATQQLMTMFYENWLGGKPPREAFRQAQLSLRTKYPEPYYWGAFVLVGN